MTCRACELALENPRVDAFEAGCDQCRARSLVVVGLADGMQATDFADALAKIFGADRVAEGEQLVSAAIRQMRAIRS